MLTKKKKTKKHSSTIVVKNIKKAENILLKTKFKYTRMPVLKMKQANQAKHVQK